MRRVGFRVVLAVLAVTVALPGLLPAQSPPDDKYQGPKEVWGLLEAIRQESGRIFDRLDAAAEWLLLTLATLSLAWKGMHLVLRNADLQEFVTELFQLVLMVGFYLVVIRNAQAWTEALTQGFLWLGSAATAGGHGIELSPAGILQQGIHIGVKMIPGGEWLPIGKWIAAAIIIVMYGLMAAYAAIAQCEVWLVVAAGMILLGFGGSDWTAEYAKRYLTYCLSASAKLYLLYLILGFGQQLVFDWLDKLDLDGDGKFMGPMGVVVMLTFLVIQLPNILQSLLNGVALHGGAPMLVGMAVSMARPAAMAAATYATGAVGGGVMAVSEAAKLAHAQLGGGGSAAIGAAVGSAAGSTAGAGIGQAMSAATGGQDRGALRAAGQAAGQAGGQVAGMVGGHMVDSVRGGAAAGPSRGQVMGQTLRNLGSGVMGMAGGHIMQSTLGGRMAQNLHARRVAAELDLGGGQGAFSGSIAPPPSTSRPYVSPAHQRE